MSSRSIFTATVNYQENENVFLTTCHTSIRRPKHKANIRFVSKMNSACGSAVQAFHASTSISAGASSLGLTDWTT
jgi:hypothetical protein